MEPQMNITKGQGNGKIFSLQRDFVVSRFFSICFTIARAKSIFRYIDDFVIWIIWFYQLG